LIYLHIGAPKTGTSSIQLLLRDNARSFEALGYYVPQIGQGKAGGHHTLVRTLAGLPVPPHQAVGESEILDELHKFKSSSIVISSEMLSSILAQSHLAETLIGKLQQVSKNIVLILFVRNQIQWLNSAYSQGVKSFRYDHYFRQFIAEVLENIDAYTYNRWPAIAQKHGVELRAQAFNSKVRSEGVSASFFRHIGVERPGHFPEVRSNESVGPFAVEAARRAMNQIPGGASGLTFMQSTRCKLALAKRIDLLPISEPSYCGLDTAEAAALELAFLSRNDEFASSMWGTSWSDVFEGDVGKEFASNDYVDAEPTEHSKGLMTKLLFELDRDISGILNNPRLSIQADWNARRA
jgi:hypothetical protein